MSDQNDSDSSATDKTVPALIPATKAVADTDAFGPFIDLQAASSADESRPAEEAAEAAAPGPESDRPWRLPPLPISMPLAASIALAIVTGALAGAATTAAFMHQGAPLATLETADATRALQSSVAQLGTELAMLKTGVVAAQKTASTQLGKIADRLDRAEKAQSEPVGKLAKIQESIDRLEHHPQQVASVPAATPPVAGDITGSVTPKDEAKPQVAEGWKLRDFYDGRAVIEGKNGTLFRVGQGSIVPGLGKVEAIKRENGKVVVVTPAGIISAALESSRRPAYYPRW